MHVSSAYLEPTPQKYFGKLFEIFDLDCTNIYLLQRVVTIDTWLRVFWYKILYNILYLNKLFFKLEKVSLPWCQFCNKEETINHLFQHEQS